MYSSRVEAWSILSSNNMMSNSRIAILSHSESIVEKRKIHEKFRKSGATRGRVQKSCFFLGAFFKITFRRKHNSKTKRRWRGVKIIRENITEDQPPLQPQAWSPIRLSPRRGLVIREPVPICPATCSDPKHLQCSQPPNLPKWPQDPVVVDTEEPEKLYFRGKPKVSVIVKESDEECGRPRYLFQWEYPRAGKKNK